MQDSASWFRLHCNSARNSDLYNVNIVCWSQLVAIILARSCQLGLLVISNRKEGNVTSTLQVTKFSRASHSVSPMHGFRTKQSYSRRGQLAAPQHQTENGEGDISDCRVVCRRFWRLACGDSRTVAQHQRQWRQSKEAALCRELCVFGSLATFRGQDVAWV